MVRGVPKCKKYQPKCPGFWGTKWFFPGAGINDWLKSTCSSSCAHLRWAQLSCIFGHKRRASANTTFSTMANLRYSSQTYLEITGNIHWKPSWAITGNHWKPWNYQRTQLPSQDVSKFMSTNIPILSANHGGPWLLIALLSQVSTFRKPPNIQKSEWNKNMNHRKNMWFFAVDHTLLRRIRGPLAQSLEATGLAPALLPPCTSWEVPHPMKRLVMKHWVFRGIYWIGQIP